MCSAVHGGSSPRAASRSGPGRRPVRRCRSRRSPSPWPGTRCHQLDPGARRAGRGSGPRCGQGRASATNVAGTPSRTRPSATLSGDPPTCPTSEPVPFGTRSTRASPPTAIIAGARAENLTRDRRSDPGTDRIFMTHHCRGDRPRPGPHGSGPGVLPFGPGTARDRGCAVRERAWWLRFVAGRRPDELGRQPR